jgi:two-component system sensor histidine kinase HydH
MEKGRALRIELVPHEAIALSKRAFLSMVIKMIAALLLGLTALVFWRMSNRSDRMQEQLARDRQLKMLGQMSAVLGHEIKNTIASLKGNAQLLAEKLGDADGGNSARAIAADSTYLQELTAQILDFARTGEIHMEKVYLDDLAEAAITFAESDPVETTIEGHASTWQLDRHKMQQVLVNLLSNARQASGTQPISLNITAGNTLHIRITDKGPGIPPEATERVFEPFYTTRPKGTGLGLAFAQQVVTQHGGTIRVETPPGGGACFVVVLPAGTEK